MKDDLPTDNEAPDAAEVNDAVNQWLAKAREDWQAVQILVAHAQYPQPVVCFHCQQHVEKLLKALLTRHQIEAPRTHDLLRLIQLAAPHTPALSALSVRADALSRAAIETRYPNDWREVTEAEMREMMALAEEMAALLLPQLKRP